MLVKDIMSTNLRTVRPEATVAEVSSIMCLYRYSGIPVVDDGKLVGFIAEKDVLQRLLPSIEDFIEGTAVTKLEDMQDHFKDLMHMKASEIMTPKVMTVPPDMHAMRAASTIVRNRWRRIPVAEGDKLIGMLSLGDIHKAIFHANISAMHCLSD